MKALTKSDVSTLQLALRLAIEMEFSTLDSWTSHGEPMMDQTSARLRKKCQENIRLFQRLYRKLTPKPKPVVSKEVRKALRDLDDIAAGEDAMRDAVEGFGPEEEW